VVGVGGVANDALVLLVEGVHRSPSERDAVPELAGLVRRAGVPPRSMDDTPVVDDDGEPIGIAEVAVLRDPVLADENASANVAERKVRDRIAPRLVEQQHILAVGDPFAAQFHAQPLAKRLDEREV
jgi:hypothetical protein